MYIRHSATAANDSACLACPTQDQCLASKLDAKQLSQLAQCGQLGRHVPKGSVVYRQSDVADRLFSVKTGAVKTFHVSEDGQQQITGFKLAGNAFGLVDMNVDKRTEYAETVTDSIICGFSQSRLKAMMAESPTLLDNFIKQCSDQMRTQQKNAKDDDAIDRVLRFLGTLQQAFSRPGVDVSGFTLPMSNKDIANYLRLRPETLSRVFQQLKASGRLQLKGRTVLSFDTGNTTGAYRLVS